MALEPDLLQGSMPDAPPPPNDDGSLFIDAPKAAFSNAVDLTAQGVGLIAQPGSPAAHARDLLNAVKDDVVASMSPKNRAAMEAEFIPGEGGQSVFTSPGKSLVMKGSGMLPMLLSAFMLPPGWAGVATGSALWGTQGAAQQLNESRKLIVATPDADLQEKSEPYRILRQQYDEAQAKEELLKKQNDLWALLTAGAGGAIGGGAMAHALKGQAIKSFARSVGVGVADAAIGSGVQGATQKFAEQQGEANVGLRNEYDTGEIARGAVNAGVEGAIVGGAFGAVAGMRGRSVPAKDAGKVVDELGPAPDAKVALDDQLAPAETKTAPQEPPTGSLQERIAAKRAALPAEEPATPVAPPEVRPEAPLPPPVRAIEPPVPQPPVQGPPSPRPTTPAPLTAAEVNTGLKTAPKRAVEPTIPMPPTDRMLAPGFNRKKLPERYAVPLEEASDDNLVALNKAVAEVQPAVTPAGKIETPTSKADVAPAPKTGTLKIASKVVETKPVEPIAKLVKAEPGKPRVFRTVSPEAEAANAAREAKIAEVRVKADQAAERRDRRARNETMPNEARAQEVVKAQHPTDAEELTNLHRDEELSLGGTAASDSARERVLARVDKVIAEAEAKKVVIPSKTTWSKEARERGETNPTPYTSRLIELRNFQRLVTAARRIETPKERETKLRELFDEHATAERALRAEDLQGAAARRLEANEKRDARREAAELKKLMKEQQADETATRENSVTADKIDENDNDTESYSVAKSNKFKHINDPKILVKSATYVSARLKDARIAHEHAVKNFIRVRASSNQKAMEAWRQNHDMWLAAIKRYENEYSQARARLKELDEHGDMPDRVIPTEGVERKTARELLQPLHDSFSTTGASDKRRAQTTLLQHIVRKFIDVVGDQPIHVASDEAFFEHNNKAGAGVEGLFRSHRKGKTVGGERGDIWIRRDLLDTIDGPRLLIHEVVHSGVWHAVEHNPIFKAELQTLFDAAKTAWSDADVRAKHDGMRTYGFTDVHEFVSEALASPTFQRFLMDTPAPVALTRKYGLDRGTSLWRTLANAVAKAFGFGREHASIFDAVMHLSDEMLAYEPPTTGRTFEQLQRGTHIHASEANSLRDLPDRVRENAPHIAPTLRSKLRSVGHKLSTIIQLGQMADRYFPEKGGTRIARVMANMAQEKERILKSGDEKLVGDMAQLQRNYAAGDTWDRFGSLLHDETMAGVYADRPLADQKHLGKDSMRGWQGKAQYAALAARYDALPADIKVMRTRLHDYYRRRQNDMTLGRLQAIVRVINDGVPDNDLAQRILDKKLDAAEKAVLEEDATWNAIQKAMDLKKVAGPYVPMMRHGEHVVSGRYEIVSPGNGRRLNDAGDVDAKGNVFEFDTRAEAKAFAESMKDLKVLKVQKIYTDPTTGERFGVDDDGTKVKLGPEAAKSGQADEKYRVHVQDKHLEFFESEMEARRTLRDLRARPGMTIDGLQARRWEPGGANSSFMSEAFERTINSLKQRKGFKELDGAAQQELVRQLQEASLQSLGSTRAASSRLPRTYVAGASDNIQKGTALYASSTSGYLARLRFQPKLDVLFKELTEHDRDYRYESDDRTQPRSQLLKELKTRAYQVGEPEPYGFWHSAGNRLLQLSFLDKLASPAFHVINSAEPWTISLPVMAGRYGVGRTVVELNKAYRDLGALGALQAGVSDTVQAFRSDQGLTDHVRRYEDRLKKAPDGKHVVSMVRELYDAGLVSRDAGMELGRMADPGGNIVGRGLDRADLMARQMGVAIESINRLVTATAAYRLEYAKTKDHAAAVEQALTTVHDTMGDYSGWNAPAVFKHPVGRLALQFKKYAQKTYYLLGKTAAASLRGDPEAMKAFAGIMATHAVLAGSLGLPLEVVKAGVLAAGLMGATDSNYGDFEQWVRKQAALGLGAAGGQIATRGLPRYLGVDLSSRMGLENLILPMGDPKSMKPDDLLAYGAKAFAGAPLSMLAEYPKGIKALWDGDVAEAARVLFPIKMFADSVQAYQRATMGKRTPSGRQTLEPYSPGEAVTKSIGFTPGRDAETSEMRGAVTGDQRRLQADRSKLTSKWVTATPAEKAAMWRQIQSWNEDQPKAARVTMKDLTDAQQRRDRENKADNFRHGYRTSKRDNFLREQENYYNLGR